MSGAVRAARLTLVLGGTRSGKSEVAERLAGRFGSVTYVATYRPESGASDADMAARVAAHVARRPTGWRTVEAGPDLPAVLAEVAGPVLVDSLGTWVAGHPALRGSAAAGGGAALPPALVAVADALAARQAPTVVVSEEVGLGLHAPGPVGRRFSDLLGALNRAVADRADDVLLVVAGRVLPLVRPA